MSPLQVRCREIGRADIDGVANLLARGFPRRPRNFWLLAFERLSNHATPTGFPEFGYLLESQSIPVGVLLLIFSSILVGAERTIRCNGCGWYVEPAFRSHAALLVSRALRHKNVTYTNITPAPHTLPILEAQGYRRYCSGRFVAVPALCRPSYGA